MSELIPWAGAAALLVIVWLTRLDDRRRKNRDR